MIYRTTPQSPQGQPIEKPQSISKGAFLGGGSPLYKVDDASQKQFRWRARRHLLPNERERLETCGAQFVGVTADGVERPWTMRCGHRYCDWCARARRGRIAARIEAKALELGAKRGYLVTLTHSSANASVAFPWGASSAIRDLGRHWNAAYDLLRRQDIGLGRVKPSTRAAWAQLIRPVHESAKVRPVRDARRAKYGKTWSDSNGFVGATRDFFRALEVKVTDATYHAHYHIVCFDLATAERINAAWQQTRHHEKFCQTDITEMSVKRAVGYATKYSTKGAEAEPDCPDGYVTSVVRALRGQRLTNGCGAFRNLGLRREAGSDPVIGVKWGGRIIPIEVLYSELGSIPVSKDALDCVSPYTAPECVTAKSLKLQQIRESYESASRSSAAPLGAPRLPLNNSHTLPPDGGCNAALRHRCAHERSRDDGPALCRPDATSNSGAPDPSRRLRAEARARAGPGRLPGRPCDT